MTRAARLRALRIAISVALLALIVWQIDALQDIGSVLAGASPELLALALVVLTADRLLMSFKWVLLLASRGLRLPLFRGFTIYCASMVWGMFLPTTVGADVLRAYLTSRTGLDGFEVTASIIVERVVGFVAALLFGLFGLVLISRAGIADGRFDTVWWAGGAALVLALAVVLLSFSQRTFETLLRLVPRRVRPARVVGKFRQFHEVYRGYGSARGVLAAFFALSLLEQGIATLGTWVIALALDIHVSLWFMAGVMPLSLLIARLPIAFDGIGLFEGVFALLMGLGGVGVAESLGIALSGRVLQTVVWLPWWFLYSIGHRGVRPPKEAVHP